MEIATETEGEAITDDFFQLLQHKLQLRPVVLVLFIGVWSANDVPDAIFHGNTTHLFSHLPTFRPIIYVGKNVTVDVNHGAIVSRLRTGKCVGRNALDSVHNGSCGK
jgi:hypothetical protein